MPDSPEPLRPFTDAELASEVPAGRVSVVSLTRCPSGMFRIAQALGDPERIPTRRSASGGGASLDQNDPTIQDRSEGISGGLECAHITLDGGVNEVKP